MSLFLILLASVGGGLGLAALVKAAQDRERRVTEAWTQVANELGLQYRAPRWTQPREMDGRFDGCVVQVSIVMKGGKQKVPFTRYEIHSPKIPPGLALASESGWRSFTKLFVGEDVRTGAVAFDGQVHVRGAGEAEVLATLGPEARRQVAELTERGATMEAGTFRLDVRGATSDPEQLRSMVQTFCQAAHALEQEAEPVSSRLVGRFSSEPNAAVRLRILQVLAAHYPNSAELEFVTEAGLDDSDGEVRLSAALLSKGARARECLEALVRGDRGRADEVGAKALERLVGFHGDLDLAALTTSALQSPALALQRAGLRLAGSRRDRSQLEAVLTLALSADEGIREGVARALGNLQEPSSEPVLIRLLSDDSDSVQLAAAKALETVGTLTAVEALLPLSKPITGKGGVRDAARDAVRAIQSRHSVGGSGGLSLVDPSPVSGAVSLTEPEGAPDKAVSPVAARKPTRG